MFRLDLSCVYLFERSKVMTSKTNMAAKQKYIRPTLEEDEILAEEVKKYPALYDKRIKDYKNLNVNNNAWTKVATSLKISNADGFTYYFRFITYISISIRHDNNR